MPTTSLVSDSPEQTEAFARQLGAGLRGGEVIELRSDLGGGKTTFTRGLAEGMDSHDHVASPTFTISREYHGRDGLALYHYDFYRLQEDAGLMSQELAEAAGDPKSVIVVEWSGPVSHVLPADRLVVTIERTDETGRRLSVDYPESYSYLLKESA
jgi:tRNA threonylcarbamoyladenosine biosynthesis protein TsaE